MGLNDAGRGMIGMSETAWVACAVGPGAGAATQVAGEACFSLNADRLLTSAALVRDTVDMSNTRVRAARRIFASPSCGRNMET